MARIIIFKGDVSNKFGVISSSHNLKESNTPLINTMSRSCKLIDDIIPIRKPAYPGKMCILKGRKKKGAFNRNTERRLKAPYLVSWPDH